MDADSDHDAGFQLGGRRTHLSSRESSPAAKRPRQSFTPTSDDGDLVVPAVHDEDTETPTPESAPLIRQAVGFSWTPSTDANVDTYQAIAPAQPVVPYYLPGQAPPPPPKPKPSKPRAPRKKKGVLFSDQTGKFKLSNSTLQPSSAPGSVGVALTAGLPDTSSSGATHSAVWRPMFPTTGYAPGGHATQDSGNVNAMTMGVASITPPPGTKRPRKSSKKQVNAPASTSVIPQYSDPGAPSVERPGRPTDVQRTLSASGGTPGEYQNTSATVNQGPSQSSSRPLRMVTLLIEDFRSGVPDPQLAEVRVPLKIADDPEDGFWGDAVEICNALQSGPARIDGPAKVYTKRGRFRQFFMRVDQLDQFEVQSAHLGVSKERTLNVFVESPMSQGQLPRPPAPPPDPRPAHSSGSELEMSPTATTYQPTYSFATREERIEQLSKKSNYAKAQRAQSPVSESGSYGHSQRTTSPDARQKSRHEHASSSQRALTPPIPGRLADTEEEKDEAIANYIRSHIENHAGWVAYMQSKANPQRVSEVLKQYTFIEERVRELLGRKTPSHWDSAPNCLVDRRHVWRVLKLDAKWGLRCQETMNLLGYYGKEGSRYEDSRVIDMINDTSLPKPNTMDKFLRLLRSVDERYNLDVLSGRFS